jgi:preprotein translocase YajC subunit
LGGFGFFIVIIAFVFLWFVLIRPQKKRQLQQQRMLNDLAVGDEIVTAGGLLGEVRGPRAHRARARRPRRASRRRGDRHAGRTGGARSPGRAGADRANPRHVGRVPFTDL